MKLFLMNCHFSSFWNFPDLAFEMGSGMASGTLGHFGDLSYVKLMKGLLRVLFVYPSLSVVLSLVGCLKVFSSDADLIP